MTRPPTSNVREHKGPFGTPDGSRSDLQDILHDFVALDGRPGFGGVATRADDAMVRVIVGRIGAGKTVYMRRLFSYQEASRSVRFSQRIGRSALVKTSAAAVMAPMR
jgi:hypothetical protein